MIRHVVFFKFKPEIDQAARSDFVDRLRSLKSIEVVQSIGVGVNFADSPRAFDVALIVDVADRQALAVYADHPQHVPVKQLAVQLCSALPLVDYELPGVR
jgi:hypothetical protein